VVTSEQTFGFLADLPQRKVALDRGICQELIDFGNDYAEHNGLLPVQTVPALLHVSRQRWDQLRKKYGFWNAQYFDKTWYSRRQIEEFYKVQRKLGKPSHEVAAVLKSLLPTVNN
jgi:hypothetical protein